MIVFYDTQRPVYNKTLKINTIRKYWESIVSGQKIDIFFAHPWRSIFYIWIHDFKTRSYRQTENDCI